MATNREPAFNSSVAVNPCVQFANADGTSAKVIYTAGADGATLNQLTAASDDTSTVTLVLSINNGTTTNIIGRITVAIGAGTTATPAANLLDSDNIRMLQADGSLVLGPNCSLEINAASAVTAAKTVYVTGAVGTFTA